jgi:hypothetical protein
VARKKFKQLCITKPDAAPCKPPAEKPLRKTGHLRLKAHGAKLGKVN